MSDENEHMTRRRRSALGRSPRSRGEDGRLVVRQLLQVEPCNVNQVDHDQDSRSYSGQAARTPTQCED